MTGARTVHLDGAGDFHTEVAAALGFPAYYGHNLDALAECLRDVAPETVLVWDRWWIVQAQHPRTFRVAARLLGGSLTLVLPDPPPVEQAR